MKGMHKMLGGKMMADKEMKAMMGKGKTKPKGKPKGKPKTY